jgi:hypothetical protein
MRRKVYILAIKKKSMRHPILISIFLLLVGLPFLAATEFTVIIVEKTTNTCKVLEGPSPELDGLIPLGWEKIVITQEQCAIALPALKEQSDLDQNVKDYLDLLSCTKESNLKSLTYFGLGAKKLCDTAGYSFASERLLVGVQKTSPAKGKLPYQYIYPLLVIIILVLLILIKRKRMRSS